MAIKKVCLCKDCKLWDTWDGEINGVTGVMSCQCTHWRECGNRVYTCEHDFCSYAEKRGISLASILKAQMSMLQSHRYLKK